MPERHSSSAAAERVDSSSVLVGKVSFTRLTGSPPGLPVTPCWHSGLQANSGTCGSNRLSGSAGPPFQCGANIRLGLGCRLGPRKPPCHSHSGWRPGRTVPVTLGLGGSESAIFQVQVTAARRPDRANELEPMPRLRPVTPACPRQG